MTPSVDPGRKGGIYSPPPAAKSVSPRARLLKLAHANGWTLLRSRREGTEFRHEDGWKLFVNSDFRGNPGTGTLFPPTGIGRAVSVAEVTKVLEGTRCCCPVRTTPWGQDYILPSDDCKLAHAYARMEAQCYEEAVSG